MCIMFYDPQLMKEIYSKYLNGIDIEDIVYSIGWLSDDGCTIKEEQVEEIIDILNRLLL